MLFIKKKLCLKYVGVDKFPSIPAVGDIPRLFLIIAFFYSAVAVCFVERDKGSIMTWMSFKGCLYAICSNGWTIINSGFPMDFLLARKLKACLI